MKKALSLFLAMLMLMSVFSVAAFAATTPELTSVVAGYNGVELKWSAVVGAAGYAVFRQDSSEAEGELIKDVVTTSYTDKNVSYGKTYKYVIATKNVDGTFSEVNFENGVKVTYDRVQLKAVYNNYDGVNLSWKATPASKNGYRIFRQVGNTKPVFLADVKTTSYVDTDVTYQGEYKYAIVSLNAELNYTETLDWNNAINVKYDLIDLQKPTCTNTGIVLEWGKVDGASEYEIYRKSNKAGDKGSLVGTANECIFNDTSVEAGVTYTYCVVVAGVAPDYANGIKVTHQLLKFDKPVHQFDGLKISWTAMSDASNYYVYRMTNATGDKTLVATTESNSYLDKSVDNGMTYTYAISVQYKNGKIVSEDYDNGLVVKYSRPICSRVSHGVHPFYATDKVVVDVQPTVYDIGYKHYVCAECGAESSKKVVAQLAPKTPEIISLHNTNLGVKLAWEVVDGADLYVVYRRSTINGKSSGWQIIRTLVGTSCYDNSTVTGGYYRYAVKAVRRTSYAYPLEVVRDADNAVNTLTWVKNFARANSYYIYRKDDPNSNFWNTLALISDKNAFISEKTGRYMMQFKDTNPNPEATGYCVRGVLISGLGSGRVIRVVKTPVGLTATNNTSGILFKWNKVAGATSYRVYRKLASDRYWTFMGYTTKTYYPDYETENNNTYVYTVRAVCHGHFSDYVREGVKIARIDSPVLVSAKSGRDGITVVWEGVEGATRYNVYRKTSTTTWKMIGKVTDMKSTAYLDKSAKKGVTYTYTIRAVKGSDMSSYYPAGVSCKDLY